MSKITSIGTAVPSYRHRQQDILQFMQRVYAANDSDKRKIKFLYDHSGIDYRHSIISDYSRPAGEWKFYPASENLEPFPTLEKRMDWYQKYAASLSIDAIRSCLSDAITHSKNITHLITVSCTGMSAPGLDLQVMELMDLPGNIFRTSINFMGCYAAIHALKLADAIANNDKDARVLIVCTELCTLHFQKETTRDSIASGLLFSDGAAAMLVTGDRHPSKGLHLEGFYAEVSSRGKKDMAWELSSTGFIMTLSGFVPDLIEEDFRGLVERALEKTNRSIDDIAHWCIHPGGKKILESIHKSLDLSEGRLDKSFEILRNYGNMSSASIVFVLERIMKDIADGEAATIFGAAFGPGLTMETFTASATIS